MRRQCEPARAGRQRFEVRIAVQIAHLHEAVLSEFAGGAIDASEVRAGQQLGAPLRQRHETALDGYPRAREDREIIGAQSDRGGHDGSEQSGHVLHLNREGEVLHRCNGRRRLHGRPRELACDAWPEADHGFEIAMSHAGEDNHGPKSHGKRIRQIVRVVLGERRDELPEGYAIGEVEQLSGQSLEIAERDVGRVTGAHPSRSGPGRECRVAVRECRVAVRVEEVGHPSRERHAQSQGVAIGVPAARMSMRTQYLDLVVGEMLLHVPNEGRRRRCIEDRVSVHGAKHLDQFSALVADPEAGMALVHQRNSRGNDDVAMYAEPRRLHVTVRLQLVEENSPCGQGKRSPSRKVAQDIRPPNVEQLHDDSGTGTAPRSSCASAISYS